MIQCAEQREQGDLDVWVVQIDVAGSLGHESHKVLLHHRFGDLQSRVVVLVRGDTRLCRQESIHKLANRPKLAIPDIWLESRRVLEDFDESIEDGPTDGDQVFRNALHIARGREIRTKRHQQSHGPARDSHAPGRVLLLALLSEVASYVNTTDQVVDD